MNLDTNKLRAGILAFRGEDEILTGDALVEVTDRTGATFEIAFDVGRVRVYLTLELGELVRAVVAQPDNSE